MNYTENEKEESQDEIVEALLNLPVKNLETRLEETEKEILTRLNLNTSSLAVLGSQQLFFKERARQLHYSLWGSAIQIKTQFETEISRLEQMKVKEVLDCFKDLTMLMDKAMEIKAELEKEKLKLKLIE